MWENYLATAVDIGEIQKAMFAMERVVELKGEKDAREDKTMTVKGNVDEQVLLLITDYTLKQRALAPGITRHLFLRG